MQRFIVLELAQFRTPSEVVEAVKERFKIDVSRQQVEHYDPTKAQGKGVAKKWRALFETARAQYLNDMAAVPIAHRRYRLEQLQKLLERALAMGMHGNIPLAKEILIEAAKEVGDVYTNRRKVDVDPRQLLARVLGVDPEELPDGGPVIDP